MRNMGVIFGTCLSAICMANSPADLNFDHTVDFYDFAILANQWLLQEDSSQTDYDDVRAFEYLVAASDAPASVKSVADYVCDGDTDEVEIDAAIAAAHAQGGGRVRLSNGNFYVKEAVALNGNFLDVAGSGFNTVLHKQLIVQGGSESDLYVIYQNGPDHHIWLHDMTIDNHHVGVPSNSHNKCIFFNGNSSGEHSLAHHFIVERVVARNATAEGICFDYSEHITIRDCHSYDNSWSGITVAQCKYVIIEGNHCYNCGTNTAGGGGATLEAGINIQNSENVSCFANYLDNCLKKGIGVNSSTGRWPNTLHTNDIDIFSNHCYGCTGGAGIYVYSSSNNKTLTGITIHNNFLNGVDSSQKSIFVRNLNGFAIKDNICRMTGSYGIYVMDPCTNGIIRDNFIATTHAVPVQLADGVTEVEWENNRGL